MLTFHMSGVKDRLAGSMEHRHSSIGAVSPHEYIYDITIFAYSATVDLTSCLRIVSVIWIRNSELDDEMKSSTNLNEKRQGN
jgi:hypothetical protein